MLEGRRHPDRQAPLSGHWDAEVLREQLNEVRAELEWQRKWCAANFGVMPPTREQNAAFMKALGEV